MPCSALTSNAVDTLLASVRPAQEIIARIYTCHVRTPWGEAVTDVQEITKTPSLSCQIVCEETASLVEYDA